MGRLSRLAALVTVSAVVGAAGGVVGVAEAAVEAQKAPMTTEKATFTANGSVYAAYVLGAKGETALMLVDGRNQVVARGRANSHGSYVFDGVKAGRGYTVRSRAGKAVAGTAPFKVLSQTDTPPASLYQQKLQQGLNYVRMRDGVEIAMTVRLPKGKTLADGPFPTVIEYSGYQVAAPKDLLDNILANLGKADAPKDPLVPDSSTAVGSLIAPLLGFAAVSVQMRGTGCSGGAADLFNWPTTFDGYDAVETVAAQPWVKGSKVGLVGISFSGISQLFVGGTRPPHLAAIAPLSVTDDLYRGTGYPGGIFNNGFAKTWLEARVEDAKPAPEGGQPWAKELVKEGDQHCIANQALHAAALNPFDVLRKNPYRTPSVFEQRSPAYWAKKIDVPTFLVGAFQDEQTGGHWPEMIPAFSGNPKLWVTILNGTHVDSLGPATLTRWVEFNNLYVGDQVPEIPPTVLALGSQLFNQIAQAPAADIQQSRFAGTTDVAAAKATFEKDPRVRILMDNGAGDKGPGALQPVWEFAATAWPPKDVKATTYYLGDKGKLTTSKPSGSGKDSYTSDPYARPLTTLPGDGEADAWKAQPPYDWKPVVDGKGLGYVTDAFTEDTTIAGPSSLDLYLQSSARDTDVQVSISEVRPDGKESYVQSGWLRASHRKDGPSSTAIDPVPTNLKADGSPLPKGKFALVRVPIFPVAWTFRAGSKLRISITAPGGDRPRWKFDTIEKGSTVNTISRATATPSKLVLAVLPGQKAGIPLPACGANRGTFCRDYVPASNGG
ncbi:MAG: CocE/NonD family hydrolase [Acidimicrobiia bacterium]